MAHRHLLQGTHALRPRESVTSTQYYWSFLWVFASCWWREPLCKRYLDTHNIQCKSGGYNRHYFERGATQIDWYLLRAARCYPWWAALRLSEQYGVFSMPIPQ